MDPEEEPRLLKEELDENCWLELSRLFELRLSPAPEVDSKLLEELERDCLFELLEDDPTADWTAAATWGWMASNICWINDELDKEEDWEVDREELDKEDVRLEDEEEEDELDRDSRVVAFSTCVCQSSLKCFPKN